MTLPFVPTHVVPATGLDTRDGPDPSRPTGPALAAGLPVQQVGQRGDWTKVACSNGWEAWVDGRRLEPLPAPARVTPPAAPPAAAPAATRAAPVPSSRPLDRSPIKLGSLALSGSLAGTAAVVGSCFLPWFSPDGQGQTAFKVPAKFLVDYKTADPSGLKVGHVLLLLAAGAVWLTVRPVSSQARKAIGWCFVLLSTVFVAQTQRLVGQIEAASVFSMLGLGVYVAAVGGVLIVLRGGDSVDQ